jgi:hypothetical protein
MKLADDPTNPQAIAENGQLYAQAYFLRSSLSKGQLDLVKGHSQVCVRVCVHVDVSAS